MERYLGDWEVGCPKILVEPNSSHISFDVRLLTKWVYWVELVYPLVKKNMDKI